ncbi:hypothetical protein [Luteimonas sp. TWI1437]|uniref:hypothetical protein n=1 Tax=unclassified Luteimonas TaxID=2629088 RepID=UPI0032093C75
MRDQHDTQTSELIPAKRGRPCKRPEMGPMTPAERAQAYRSRRRSRAGLARDDARRADARRKLVDFDWLRDYTDAQLLEAIRLQVADVREVDTKSGRAAAAKLVAELARRYPAA